MNCTNNRRAALADSTIVANRAWITFDNEQPIAASTWVNIVVATPPTSYAWTLLQGLTTGLLRLGTVAGDNLSGGWKYSLYGMLGETDVLIALGHCNLACCQGGLRMS